jgi:hypothetical protein
MFGTSIKAAVMQQVNRIIKEKQLAYDEEVRRIDTEVEEKVEQLYTEADTKKVVLKEEIVESIISKFR